MSYKGRVALIVMVGIVIIGYGSFYYITYGKLGWGELIGYAVLLMLAWYCGKQYDLAHYYSKRYKSDHEQLKAVLEHNADGIIIWDRDWIVLEVNQAFQRIYGWSKEELVGTKLESMNKDIVNEVEEKLEEVVNSGSLHYETKRFQKDGSEIYVDATLSLIKNKQGEPTRIVGIVRDVTEKKKTEQRLAENEERFRMLVDNSPTAIFIHTGGKFVFANATAAKMFHAESEQDFIGRDIWEVIHPDEWEKVRKRIEKTQKTHKVAEALQEKLIKADGETFFAEVTSSPITYQGQKANQVVARDVTYRKEMEDQLRESERQLRGITDNMMDMLAQLNKRFIFEYVTPSYERTLGYAPSELIGKNALEFIHPDDIDLVKKYIHKAFKGNQHIKLEFRYKTAHGNYVWIESVGSLFFNDNEEFQGSIIVSRNIAERKETEALVLKQERMLQGVSEATRQLLTTLDYETSINKALSMLGQTMNIDRVYIFETKNLGIDGKTINLRFEWTRDTVEPVSASGVFASYHYEGTGFEDWVIQLEEGKVVSPILQELPLEELKKIQSQGVRSLLLVPIFVQQQFWGFIGFDDCYSERRWTKNEKATLSATAVSIAGAIERHSQEKQLRIMLQNNKQLAARMSALLTNLKAGVLVVDQEKIITLVNEEFCDMFHIHSSIESLVGTPSTNLFRDIQHLFVNHESFLTKIRSFYQKREVVINEEIELIDGRTFELDYIPIYVEDNYSGHLWYYRDITERKSNEQRLKETNEMLTRLSSLDGLTSIANRRYFDEYLLQKWGTGMSERSPISLIMFDIDQFKKYNDSYGHQQGDHCLKAVARALKQEIGDMNKLIARYGGEEFAIVLPERTINEALGVAEKVRIAIESMRIPHRSSFVADVVTVSIGVAEIVPSEEFKPETLIERADKALYYSKNTGRNKVTAYDEEMELPIG